MKFLFIAGCPRSGTTALLELLNADEQIILGLERFKFVRETLSPAYFTEERFFDIREEETNKTDPELYATLRKRWSAGSAAYVGDKVPGYFYQMKYLLETFPDSKILFLFRDVA